MNFIQKIFFLPQFLKGYSMTDPKRNGEYLLMRSIVHSGMTIFDVGANVGEYSEQLFKCNNNIKVHCFEPSIATYKVLKNKLCNNYQNKIWLNNFGLSDCSADYEMFIYNETGGSNSLYYNEHYALLGRKVKKEKIHLETLDDYIFNQKIKTVDFLKIDVEGHEYKILLGGINAISRGIIKRIQFEYNDFWLTSGYKLIDTLEILNSHNFNLFRLTPWGKIKINQIKPELEIYKYSNYYSILK